MCEPADDLKACRDCGQLHPLDSYRQRSDRPHVRSTRCDSCLRIYNRGKAGDMRARRRAEATGEAEPREPIVQIDAGVLGSAFRDFMAGCARSGGNANSAAVVA